MKKNWNFENSYLELPDIFYSKTKAENFPKLDTILKDYNPVINQNKVEILTKQPNLDLPKIILKLSESNIRIEDVQLPKASLEDVFIDLTGRKIND